METMITKIVTRSQEPGLYHATLPLDHLDFHRFWSHAEDQDDVVLLGTKWDADWIIVQCGCSTLEILDRLVDAWG
jgi:hypothetical protein